jgi:hypothetical protein
MKKIWQDQLEFNKMFFKTKGKDFTKFTLEEKQQWTKEYLLHLVCESTEVLREIKWKMHRKEDDKEVILSNISEESIDIFKFLMGIFQIWGITYEDFVKQYWDKTQVVKQRFEQEHSLTLVNKKKCVALDIDGVLLDWETHFLKYANKKLHKHYTHTKDIPTMDYTKVKHEYRDSGAKKNIKAFYDASEFTKKLKKLGYSIVLITSRPYKEYLRIYSDTLFSLKKNDILYDAVYWDEKKHIKILKELPDLKFIVEDNTKFANEIAQEGYEVFLINRQYNLYDKTHDDVVRIDKLSQSLKK